MEETDHTMVLEKTVLLLQKALHEIPDVEKQTYLEALERVPLLVKTESDPSRFLRCVKYDAGAAAHRLVSYREVRKKIFGPDRAFLPMTQNGAMAEDMVYSEKGFITMLPDDDHGRPVLCCDRIRSTAAVAPRASVLRCSFYVLQVLSEQERAQKGGYVLMLNYRVSMAAGAMNVVRSGKCQSSSRFSHAPRLLLHRDSIFTRISTEHSRRISC